MPLTWQEKEARDQQRREEMAVLFQAIMAAMPGWTRKPAGNEDTPGEYVLAETGTGLKVGFQRSRSGLCDKVEVSTFAWPEYTYRDGEGQMQKLTIRPSQLRDPGESSPSISCAISRGAEAIVKDIRKRLLPEYTRIYQRCADKAAIEWQRANEAVAGWEAISKVTGGKVERNAHYIETGRLGKYDFQVENRNGRAHVVLDCGADTLALIIAALRVPGPGVE